MTTDLAPKRKQRRYTEEDITRGLTEIAAWAGNTQAAADSLKQQGHPIPRETLRDWAARTHADRYRTVRLEIAPRLRERIAAECEDRAIAQGHLEAQIEAHLAEQIPDLKPAEAAGALRNVSTSKAINVDKAQLLRDKPTAIVEQRPPEELIRKLMGVVVDSTATEIPTSSVLATAPQRAD